MKEIIKEVKPIRTVGTRKDDSERIIVERYSFENCPRYAKHELTDEQIEELTDKAAEKAVNKAAAKAVLMAKSEIIMEVGTFTINKIKWLVGLCTLALLYFAIKSGLIIKVD